MSDGWIADRYRSYSEKNRRQMLKEQRHGATLANVPAMLARLREQIVEYVNEYNGVFPVRAQDVHCRAFLEDISGSGFVVSVGSSNVRVTRQKDMPIILIEFSISGGTAKEPVCIEVSTNDDGDPGYVYGEPNTFVTEVEIARITLDPILCG